MLGGFAARWQANFMTFQALQPRAAGPAAGTACALRLIARNDHRGPVALGGVGTMGVAFFWSRWFPELRTARWLDGRG